MARNKLLSYLVLLPISKVYGAVMTVRNKLFDMGILKQHTFKVPTVVVGNISMGGTGKTPHTEYIIEALRTRYKMGVLSRGYRRATKGFIQASRRSRPEDIGDEPYQIYQKYSSDVDVAVCEDRVEGINRMLELDGDIDLIVLDDAFQHRYVKPSVSIVLMEFNRPPFFDKMLPYGRLREDISALNRVDMVVVTKCPEEMKPMEVRIFKENLNLFAYQKLYFSRYAYGHLVPVFPESARFIPRLDDLTQQDALLVLTGVANPRPFVRHLRHYGARIKIKRFTDHHSFSHADMEAILKKYQSINAQRTYIVTTEKDAVRLANNPYFPPELKPLIYYIPIHVEFIPDRHESDPFDVALLNAIKAAWKKLSE